MSDDALKRAHAVLDGLDKRPWPVDAETEVLTKRQISHAEAKESLRRLINSHFRQEPCARVSIPARPDYDDDLILTAYVDQQAASPSPPAPSVDDVKRTKEYLRSWIEKHEVGKLLPDEYSVNRMRAALASLERDND